VHQPAAFAYKGLLLVGEDGVTDRTAVLFDDLYWNGDQAVLTDPVAATSP
jgi:hypothetical protein